MRLLQPMTANKANAIKKLALMLCPVVLCHLLAATTVEAGQGMIDLKPGDIAPLIKAEAIDGSLINSSKMKGKVIVLTFYDTNQKKSNESCNQLGNILNRTDFEGRNVKWITILSKRSDPEEFKTKPVITTLEPYIIHDVSRKVFGLYEIFVVPCAIVINDKGIIAHISRGATYRFSDTIIDAVAYALGDLSKEEFELALNPSSANEPSENEMRAERLIQLAKRLIQHDMGKMAEDKYREAINVFPEGIKARLSLGRILVSAKRFDEAETLYREALELDGDLVDAVMGLALSQAVRGDSYIEEVERRVLEVLKTDQKLPLAHYVMGVIFQQKGKMEAAALEFKTAADLLFEQIEITATEK